MRKQTRSFCYVDDMVDGLTRLMNAEDDFDGPINLGNPIEVTITELAELIIFVVGSRSKLDFRPLPKADPRRRCPDITRAKQLLHWSPKVPLEKGFGRTIAYFDSLLSSPSELKKLLWEAAV